MRVLVLILFVAVATIAAAADTSHGSPTCLQVASVSDLDDDEVAHGGGLNACGCHFNRKTGECHCHQPRACGCACQPAGCK